jgi:hypothetical protein
MLACVSLREPVGIRAPTDVCRLGRTDELDGTAHIGVGRLQPHGRSASIDRIRFVETVWDEPIVPGGQLRSVELRRPAVEQRPIDEASQVGKRRLACGGRLLNQLDTKLLEFRIPITVLREHPRSMRCLAADERTFGPTDGVDDGPEPGGVVLVHRRRSAPTIGRQTSSPHSSPGRSRARRQARRLLTRDACSLPIPAAARASRAAPLDGARGRAESRGRGPRLRPPARNIRTARATYGRTAPRHR